jgi:hypothetical protein
VLLYSSMTKDSMSLAYVKIFVYHNIFILWRTKKQNTVLFNLLSVIKVWAGISFKYVLPFFLLSKKKNTHTHTDKRIYILSSTEL